MGTACDCASDDEVRITSNYFQRVSTESKPDEGPDPRFPDMEEWEGERYTGIGIKRMKGYKCSLKIDELKQKREEFWKTKYRENKNWEIIQQICVFDEERSNLTLGKFNFQVFHNCVNHIVDDYGYHYYVPNYCINDPYYEKILSTNDVPDRKIRIVLSDSNSDSKISVACSNHKNGKFLKDFFVQKAKLNPSECKIRLFFSGVEIKDDDFIYMHKLEDDYLIQVMKIML